MTYAIVKQSDLETIQLFPVIAAALHRAAANDEGNVELPELEDEYFEEVSYDKGADLA